jgi:hypothetical protein
MELDHVFILCDEGAPEADALLRLGLREGSSNTHAGQGTAGRRFFFANAYLELLWVHDAAAAGRDAVKRTRLLDRWALRRAGACPFGVVARPALDEIDTEPGFATWRYTPPYLPAGLAIDVAEDVPLAEPALFYVDFRRVRACPKPEPIDHAVPLTTVCAARISGPVPEELSPGARALVHAQTMRFEEAPDYTLTLDFSGAPDATADLRGELPLVLRWSTP